MSASESIYTLLPRIAATLQRPGDFFARGAAELPVVRISVAGLGVLGLPIPPVQLKELTKRATPAPYGRGPDTIVDRNVRRCGQIQASDVQVEDARWRRTLAEIVREASLGLGVEGEVSAELYKLLVYKTGDFFTEHRDTEKEPGMFATLVLVLPSEHAGGELVVRHDGREAVVDLARDDVGVVSWAAFYADCQHELRPLRSGHRVALVYNLVRPQGRLSNVPDQRHEVSLVATALRVWAADPDGLLKLVFPLTHHYSLAEMAFDALKNEDAAVANVFRLAASEADCVLRLAMVSIEESGSAEPIWDGGYSRYGGRDHVEHDAEEYEVVEVFDRIQTLDGWRRTDDTVELLGPIPFEDDELSPPSSLDDEDPDEDHFLEASGNEGCSFERVYRRAALVLWPAARELEVLDQAGPEAGVAVVERFLEEPTDAKRAAEMAELVVAGWPAHSRDAVGASTLRARLLQSLVKLESARPLRAFLRDVVTAGAFDDDESAAIVLALSRFEHGEAGDFLLRLVESSGQRRFGAVARLLLLAASERAGDPYVRAVTALVESMASNTESSAFSHDPNRVIELNTLGLVNLVGAVGAVQSSAAAANLVHHTLAFPSRWRIDAVVVPAAIALQRTGNSAYLTAADGLRAAAIGHLRKRLALPLAPPTNAVRSAENLTCRCEDCTSFKAFLRHPVTMTWSLKAAKLQRAHLASKILSANCDVDTYTQMTGSPHTLVCTKNQASYEARLVERRNDAAALERLV